MKYILDTNVLVRFLVGDVVEQQRRAASWFREAEQGKRKIVVLPIVVAEVCFVLDSFYKQERKNIADAMEVFLSQRWLDVENRDTILNLWTNYRKGLHFVDSFLIASAIEHSGKVLSFDKALLKKS